MFKYAFSVGIFLNEKSWLEPPTRCLNTVFSSTFDGHVHYYVLYLAATVYELLTVSCPPCQTTERSESTEPSNLLNLNRISGLEQQ